MKRFITLCLCIATATIAVAQLQTGRKKVAVVLSGGGAKGAAHARALKVIEEAGIPIDYIVGTSIGSLVGGLYASGYNAQQIDSIMSHQNWKSLLTDISERKELDIMHRQYTDGYMLTAKFDKSPFEIMDGGILKGNNIAKLLTRLTADTPDSIDFNTLKIPFACVATDLATGKEIDMNSGILAESMRASMAIPGVFAPVRKGKMVLADGGMTNNYPVDVARKMGADYVIGVNLNSGFMSYDKIKTTMNVSAQLLDIICGNKVDENIASTDVYINVNVEGYSAASFNNEAIDTLLARGEQAARKKWDELIALREKLGLDAPADIPVARSYPDNTDITPVASIYKEHYKENFIGIGARFDSEELASLLIGGMYELHHKSRFRIGLRGRLGRRLGAELTSAVNLNKSWATHLSYNFIHNEYALYDKGKRASNEDYNGHLLRMDFSRNWNNIRAWIGAEFSYYHFADPLVNKEHMSWADDTGAERGYSYFARVTFDNRDAHMNAHRGLTWSLGYRYFTDNVTSFEGGSAMNIFDANISIAIPVSSKCTITPNASGRWVPSSNTYFTQVNAIGGVNTNGYYVPQQIAFAGVNHLQLCKNNIIVAGITWQQFITTNNYLFLVTNYGMASDKPFRKENFNDMFGAALGYGYKTPVGPVEANINWSNVTKKVGFTVNLGYMF